MTKLKTNEDGRINFSGGATNSQTIRSNLLLLTTAAIWGFAFVAQRVGAQYLGTFTFNGVRFALGAFSLLPLIMVRYKKTGASRRERFLPGSAWRAGTIAGAILFSGASLQQLGLVETTAGKAAFITGLYIVIVPLLGIFLQQRIHPCAWLGVAVATAGLYLLCITKSFTIAGGDLLELSGAFFWALHILAIDRFLKKVDAVKLSFIQFLTCAALSLIVASFFEKINPAAFSRAMIPLLYGGIGSVGVAYTLQVVGQKHAKPSHAALILSMETVFAGIGGSLILGETLGVRGYLGCVLMLAGMLLAQFSNFKPKEIHS